MSTPKAGSGDERGPAPHLPHLARIATTERVREQIESAIERGELRPGDRLPSERELTEMLGVSRVSVREAIRSLEALGLLEVQQGRGCFVTAGPGDGYADAFARWLSVHRGEVVDLLRIRRALDVLAAESAARRVDDGGAARLQELAAAFGDAQAAEDADVEELMLRDKAFHDAIAELGGSPLIATLLGELRDHMDRSRRLVLSDPGRARSSVDDHQAVVEAILARDPVAARLQAASHIDRICAALEDTTAAALEGGA